MTDARTRLKAALEILSASSSPIAKLRSVKSLVSGINPRLDTALTQYDANLAQLEAVWQGDVVQLGAESLPEGTEEEKKRKKYLLLFLKSWGELKAEVARVQSEMDAAKQGGGTASMWGRIFSATKGPLAVITVIAIGLVALGSTAAEVTIENDGCSTLSASGMPVSVPGLSLPETIPTNGSGVASLPPLSFSVDGTSAGAMTFNSLGFDLSIQLPSSIADVTFDGQSLLGKVTDVALAVRGEHTVRISCR